MSDLSERIVVLREATMLEGNAGRVGELFSAHQRERRLQELGRQHQEWERRGYDGHNVRRRMAADSRTLTIRRRRREWRRRCGHWTVGFQLWLCNKK